MPRPLLRPPAPSSSVTHRIEPLEPRALLTSYTTLTAFDAYDLGRLIHDVPVATEVPGNFGFRAALLGDINGDGSPDFAISAPGVRGGGGSATPAFDDPWTGEAGAVYLYSGRDRSLIRTLSDSAPGFGAALLNVGDLNHDGVPDLAVGCPSYDSNPDDVVERYGRVWLYSGANGDVLGTLNGTGPVDELGWSLWSAGDSNNDGTPELLAGAPGAGRVDGQPGPGQALVFSLADRTILRTFTGEHDGDRFGHALGGGVDTLSATTNAGDGVPDYLIGAPGNDEFFSNNGRAYQYDGATGTLKFVFSGHNTDDLAGSAVAVVGAGGDQTGVTLRYLIGAPGGDRTSGIPGGDTIDCGRVEAYDINGHGSTGPILNSTIAGERAGSRITLLAGLYGDPLPAYAIFSEGDDALAPVRIFRFGVQNDLPQFVSRSARDATTLVYLGDADADAIPDLLVVSRANAGLPVRLVPEPLVGLDPVVDTTSPNSRYAIIGPYVALDGALKPIATLPGLLAGDRLIRVNNAGLFVGVNTAGLSTPFYQLTSFSLDRVFFYDGMQRTSLAQAITRTIGPTPLTVALVGLSTSGDAVFNGFGVAGPEPTSAFRFRAGTLRNLWNGSAVGVSDTGVVAGNAILANGNLSPVRYTAAGTVVTIPGMLAAEAINPRGDIYGHNAAFDIRLFSASTGLTATAAPRPDLSSADSAFSWSLLDAADSGVVIGRLSYSVGGVRPSSAFTDYLLIPGQGLVRVSDTFVAPQPQNTAAPQLSPPIQTLSDGRIRYFNSILTPVADPAFSTQAADGAALASTSTAAASYSGFINVDGRAVVARSTFAGTSLQALQLKLPNGTDITQPALAILLYTSPRDGQAYAIVRTEFYTVWFRTRPDGLFQSGTTIPEGGAASLFNPDPQSLSVVAAPDGRIFLFGQRDDGTLVALLQSTLADPRASGGWSVIEISADLSQRGIIPPQFQGRPTSFVTAWNAVNLVGLDAAGHAQAVWLAPGATNWSVEDLTQRAGAPVLSGSITAFATPWNAMNVIGTDSAGHPVAIWWVPNFGPNWRFDQLSTDSAAPALDNSTLSALVTPWNAMSIIGRDRDTGILSSYWWSPATNRWTAEPIDATLTENGGSPFFPTITAGPTRAFMAGPTQTLLAVRASNNHVLRYTWNPGDGEFWTIQDLA